MTPKQKAIRNALQAAGYSHITCHRDERVTVKSAYFYSTSSLERFENRITRIVQEACPDVRILDSRDEFASWPHTSYYVVEMQP